MAYETIKSEEQQVIKRTASVLIKDKKTDVTGRTCPVYVVREDVLALDDIVNEKPLDYPNEIHISWLDKAFNQLIKETTYSAWDLIQAPQGAWVSTAYGNKCGIVAGADSQVAITLDNGNTWETVSVIADLSCIAFGSIKNTDDTITNRFIALSSTGQGIYSDDNGKTWQALTMPNDNYTGIAFIQGKFFAISSTGKIYVSYDMGITFNELNINVAGFQFTSIATDGEKRIMIVGSSGTNRALYSDNVGVKFEESYLAQNTWTSVAYGEGKFIAVSTDGDNNIAVFDVNTNNWAYTQAPTQEEWRSISYGARVFTAVATSGKVISSLDGNRWIAVSGHNGEWNTILRTNFFFIALSIAENEQGYNAMRSSNAGLTLNEFATLQEMIDEEDTLKAVSPQVLIDYLRYRIGKNQGQFVTYDKDNYINTLVEKANSLNIKIIDDTSPITSYDQITEDGHYLIINKDLINKPSEYNYAILTVTSYVYAGIKVIKQHIYNQWFYSAVSYQRQYDTVNQWSNWTLIKLSQDDINNIDLSADNITVSKTITQTAVNTLLVTDTAGRTFKTNILDIANGGHGGTTVEKARDNLKVYNFESVSLTNADTLLKDGLYKGNGGWSSGTPNGNTWGFIQSFFHKEDRARQYFYNWGGSLYIRTRTGTTTWSDWILLRNDDGSIPVNMGGTGTTVGALPFSSTLKKSIIVSDDFTTDLNVGDFISIALKNITKPVITQTYVQNGTYLVHYCRFHKDTHVFHDNVSILKVATPSNKTDIWSHSLDGMANIIRIK